MKQLKQDSRSQVSNLYNKLRETTDSGSGDGAAITSSDDISYAPGGLMMGHSAAVIPLTGLKGEWDEHRKKRKKKMREAIDVKVQQLHIDISNALKGIAQKSKLTYQQYIKAFSYTKNILPPNVLIDAVNIDNSIQRVSDNLGDDVGELELILTTIEGMKPLNKFEAFSKYDYLFGCRLQSTPIKTVTFIYEGIVDQELIERETIIIGDPDVSIALERKGIQGIKIQKTGRWSRVYPLQRYFDTNFYIALKEVLSSDFEGTDDNGGSDESDTEEII